MHITIRIPRTLVIAALMATLTATLLAACTNDGGPSAATPTSAAQGVPDTEDYTEYQDGDLPLLGEPTIRTTTDTYTTGLAFVTDMAWAPDGRLFVTEKGGSLRVISQNGELDPDPVIKLNTDGAGERGLLGIALDPDFTRNHYIWLYHIANPDETSDEPRHQVVRITERNGNGRDLQVAWELRVVFLENTILYGGGLRFGPDGMLYISPGSGNNILVAKEPDELHGKILRYQPGIPLTVPPDNPQPDSPIYASGLRNTFKIAFNPETGVLYGSENGPNCDDEINRLLPGGHYGLRIDGLCENNNPPPDYAIDTSATYVKPVLSITPTVSPTGMMFYDGSIFPEWQGYLFFCSYNDGKINYLRLKDDGFTIEDAGHVAGGGHNCTTSISTGPDGAIYFSDIASILRIDRAE